MHRRDDETSLRLATRFLYGKQIDVAPLRGQLHNLKKMERFPIMGSKKEPDRVWQNLISTMFSSSWTIILLLGFSKKFQNFFFLILLIFRDTLKLERYMLICFDKWRISFDSFFSKNRVVNGTRSSSFYDIFI